MGRNTHVRTAHATHTGSEQLKANAVRLFKNKGVTSFKTV